MFSNAESKPDKIEFVSNCRYLGILIDKTLLPAVYDPKMILGFYFKNQILPFFLK